MSTTDTHTRHPGMDLGPSSASLWSALCGNPRVKRHPETDTYHKPIVWLIAGIVLCSLGLVGSIGYSLLHLAQL